MSEAATAQPPGPSLGLVRPRRVIDFVCEEHPGWTADEQRKIDGYVNQLDLFQSAEQLLSMGMLGVCLPRSPPGAAGLGVAIKGNRPELLAVLERVDAEGWNGNAATDLLLCIRDHVVVPQVVSAQIRGAAAEQAISTGWAAAWEVLHSPSIRSAGSPWGVIWVAVRRAVMGEDLAAAYATQPRKAWRASRGEGGRTVAGLQSLTVLAEHGWESAADQAPDSIGLLDALVGLLAEVGWTAADARDVLEAVGAAAPWDCGNGWRRLARLLDVEPWRIRRLIQTLANLQPSAVEALVGDAETRAHPNELVDHLRCTVVKHWPSPSGSMRAAS